MSKPAFFVFLAEHLPPRVALVQHLKEMEHPKFILTLQGLYKQLLALIEGVQTQNRIINDLLESIQFVFKLINDLSLIYILPERPLHQGPPRPKTLLKTSPTSFPRLQSFPIQPLRNFSMHAPNSTRYFPSHNSLHYTLILWRS